MKVTNALLIISCLCLLNACQGSKDFGSEPQSGITGSEQSTLGQSAEVTVTEDELLKDLSETNLNILLKRKLLSKNGALAILSFYKNNPDSETAKLILIKNNSLIIDELVRLQLEKASSNNLKELLITIGDESYYAFSKIFTYASEDERSQLVSILKEVAHEKDTLREAPECGIKDYKSKEDILCGVQSYNRAREKVCGAERFNAGTDMTCPGAWVEQKKIKEEVPCEGDRPKGSCYRTYQVAINHPATCEAERFGVKTWKECEDKSFGVAHYNICAHEEFGVKTFNSCNIRKTRQELEIYIQSRNADINLNGSLLLANQTLLIKQSRSAETLACFIEKYADNPLATDVMNDLLANFEIVTGKEYSKDLAINCEEVRSLTENYSCDEDFASDMCKTKRSLDAANKYFKENIKEIMLLSFDVVAEADQNFKERLEELRLKLEEYVR